VATVVATMARVLGIHAVAEGIETPAQAEHLHRLGYRLAQGFHFARPVPAAQLAASLDAAAVPA
jgi:EAL domain-containing protein (putative c-di-GMP-specific phosphodiesterase class I)